MSLESDRKQILVEVRTLPTDARRRFREDLWGEIVNYTQRRVADGRTLGSIARELSISKQTVVRARDSEPVTPRLLPVRVAAEAASPPPITVRTQEGVTIEGLDVDGAARLIVALR